MSSERPRLRDSTQHRLRIPDTSLYPIGQLQNSLLSNIGRQLVRYMAMGIDDVSGSNFGDIFASAVGGEHRDSPLGIADVIRGRSAWSVKTVKSTRPFDQRTVRLISGRNSPDYSAGIQNPHDDPTLTGSAVLNIWNTRVDFAQAEYIDLRIAVLIRNMQRKEFVIFEEEASRYSPGDYLFTFNSNGNLEGHDRVTGGHHFTWQPHGSQFTVFRNVPGSARSFTVDRPIPVISEEAVLSAIGYEDGWIGIH